MADGDARNPCAAGQILLYAPRVQHFPGV